jgi:hypothetical protein
MAITIRCLAATYYGGYHIAPHRHVWGQLIYAAAGLMRLRAGGTLWIVPPAARGMGPAGAEHEIRALGDFAMRTLYFPAAMVAHLPAECCALDVPPLLRELVLELVERCPIDESDQAAMRLTAVAIDRIAEARTLPLQLPLPRDPRALRLAELLRTDPASPSGLADLSRAAGASPRTIQRLFLAETGCPSRNGASACDCSTALPRWGMASRSPRPGSRRAMPAPAPSSPPSASTSGSRRRGWGS